MGAPRTRPRHPRRRRDRRGPRRSRRRPAGRVPHPRPRPPRPVGRAAAARPPSPPGPHRDRHPRPVAARTARAAPDHPRRARPPGAGRPGAARPHRARRPDRPPARARTRPARRPVHRRPRPGAAVLARADVDDSTSTRLLGAERARRVLRAAEQAVAAAAGADAILAAILPGESRSSHEARPPARRSTGSCTTPSACTTVRRHPPPGVCSRRIPTSRPRSLTRSVPSRTCTRTPTWHRCSGRYLEHLDLSDVATNVTLAAGALRAAALTGAWRRAFLAAYGRDMDNDLAASQWFDEAISRAVTLPGGLGVFAVDLLAESIAKTLLDLPTSGAATRRRRPIRRSSPRSMRVPTAVRAGRPRAPVDAPSGSSTWRTS